MRFITDDQGLQIGIRLSDEHRDVDLSRDGLGDACLDFAVMGMLDAHARIESPEGQRWPRLALSTIRRKKHALIGIDTGTSGITSPDLYVHAPRDISSREAWWMFPSDDKKLWKIGHGWQNGTVWVPARRLIGWTRRAIEQATERIKRADFDARS